MLFKIELASPLRAISPTSTQRRVLPPNTNSSRYFSKLLQYFDFYYITHVLKLPISFTVLKIKFQEMPTKKGTQNISTLKREKSSLTKFHAATLSFRLATSSIRQFQKPKIDSQKSLTQSLAVQIP